MAAALWSSSGAEVMNFSALTMISFFHNHAMLQVAFYLDVTSHHVQVLCNAL
jgi:predicted NAD/FAD-binding protein